MKRIISARDAAKLVKSGASIMIGGFLDCGVPDKIIGELLCQEVNNLTIICNDTSYPDKDKGKLIDTDKVKKVITSHIGTNPITGKKMMNKEIEVEIVPMGTLVEKIRAQGAGLGGILTPTGVGTILEEGKKTYVVNGKKYIFEEPLGADIAFIYGTKADKYGNISYMGTTRNFNQTMATAADVVVVQADEIVECLDPNEVIIPGVFVDYIVEREGD
ncbi:MAG: CoA transferase subunit A [Candidatus Gastranaerophilales bacterium]|nr:CoA transferase subunit A [Candidatus Gastranaerophilales bacterium]